MLKATSRSQACEHLWRMTQFIIFFIIGLAGVFAGHYFARRRKVARFAETKTRRAGRGAIERRQAERDENINKLKEYVNGKERITNDEIERFLGVSDSTATRYMDELEKEGLVEQIGKEGRHVYYKIK